VLLRGKVSVLEQLGELTIAYIDVGGPDPIIVKLPNTSTLSRGQTAAFSAPTERLHLFDQFGNRIGD
jgi:ABC-type sugar transport system ATPase subunit